jgi:hypothetical protein
MYHSGIAGERPVRIASNGEMVHQRFLNFDMEQTSSFEQQ